MVSLLTGGEMENIETMRVLHGMAVGLVAGYLGGRVSSTYEILFGRTATNSQRSDVIGEIGSILLLQIFTLLFIAIVDCPEMALVHASWGIVLTSASYCVSEISGNDKK
jgi:hypothetical protein